MKNLLSRLSKLPHRAVGSLYEIQAFDIIADYLEDEQISIKKQAFSSPPHFIATIWWALGGIVGGLLLVPYFPLIGLIINVIAVASIYVFFDWHPVWLSKLPPQVKTHNLILNNTEGVSPEHQKLILMAHWDTVPISIMYHPKLLQGFEKSLWFNLVVMFMTTLCCLAYVVDFTPNWLQILRGVFIGYLIFQCFWIVLDFWRYGYSNGANDNGTGCVTAIEVAQHFWNNPIEGLDVQVVLMGAEEVGLIGSEYFAKHTDLKNTTIINFDNVGFDNVFVIKSTQTFSKIDYTKFDIYKTARFVAENTKKYNNIIERVFRTTNVDSAPFAQKGIPSITLTSVDKSGLPTNIHRPEDVLDNVNWASVELTVDYTIDIVKKHFSK